ncbi:hypothetical protein AYO49_05670 [Verrucomicrobiaceae bacterium SCGC AG-212-N21]|nr:hypothetical protein AYO49_05670 [Verrucomicrobiaceae bacterium SCGC AG-212-N21]
MNEIGPLLELEEVVEYPEQSLWTMTVDEQTVVFAEHHDEARQLMLSVDVAEMPGDRRAELLDELLRFNGRWDETGGLCMSLDAEGRTVQQSAVLPIEGLDSRTLHNALESFLATMNNWRRQILHQEEGAIDRTAEAPPDQGDTPPEFGIRI